jgi:hypothetical protein
MNDGRGRKRNRLLVLAGLTAILIAATGVASAYVIGRHTQNLLAWRPAGIPASVPLDRINLMALNHYHTAVADVAAFSRDHQLTSIPDWHFFTGPVASLRTVWRDYNVAVQAPGPDADIIHSSVVYFIDPAGRERYLASPEADHTKSGASYLPAGQVAAWGQGIAQIAGLLAG